MPFINPIQAQPVQQVHFNAPTRPRFIPAPEMKKRSLEEIKMSSGSSLGEAAGNAFKELSNFIDDREFQGQIETARQSGDIRALLGVKPRTKEQAMQLQNARDVFSAIETNKLREEQIKASELQRQVNEQALFESASKAHRRQQAFNILNDGGIVNPDSFTLSTQDMMDLQKAEEALASGKPLPFITLDDVPTGVQQSATSGFTALTPQQRIGQEMIAYDGKSPTAKYLDSIRSRGSQTKVVKVLGEDGKPRYVSTDDAIGKTAWDKPTGESFSKQNRDQFVKDNLAKFMMENPNATEDDINQASIRFASDYHTATKSALSGERGIGKIEDTRSSIGGSFTGFAIGSEKFNKLDKKRQSAIRQAVGKLENSTSGKALISSMKGKIGDFNAMSKTASRIAPLLGKEVNTNLWNSFVDTIQTYTGMEGLQNIQDQQVRTDVMSIGSLMLKIQSGATVSDKERADFYRSMGSLAQTSPALMVGLRNKLETSLAAMTGDRYLEPDLYDLKFGESTDIMKNAIATIDNNLIKYGGKQPSKITVSAGDYSAAFR